MLVRWDLLSLVFAFALPPVGLVLAIVTLAHAWDLQRRNLALSALVAAAILTLAVPLFLVGIEPSLAWRFLDVGMVVPR